MDRLMSISVSIMRVTSRDFQRDFAKMKTGARVGEVMVVTSGAEEFVFQSAKTRSWQGALQGRARIVGDIFHPGLKWEVTR